MIILLTVQLHAYLSILLEDNAIRWVLDIITIYVKKIEMFFRKYYTCNSNKSVLKLPVMSFKSKNPRKHSKETLHFNEYSTF